MTTIYVCGAYRSRWGLLGILWHIWKARQAMKKLSRDGYCVFCPHTTWAFMNHRPSRFWLDCGLEMLKKCDAIYLMRGWYLSEGSLFEVQSAQILGLTILREE